MGIEVLQPGMLTTIQDRGRIGYGEFGIPQAGAMDIESLEMANILVGNHWHQGCIEMTLLGPALKFEESMLIGITGGDLSPTLNGEPVAMYKTIPVQPGDTLRFGGVKTGARAYLAVSGGFDLPLVMGSQSTYLKGEFGGYQGRKLAKGDKLPVNSKPITKYQMREIPYSFRRQYDNNQVLRVILGSEDQAFSAKGMETFFKESYTMTAQSDRMGYRLTGPKIEHKKGADIISGGIQFGAIQVPGHGEAIIMMADRQTTGGYTKIAHVISQDLPYLAQMKTGDTISFQQITIEEAQELAQDRYRELQDLEKHYQEGRYFQVKVQDKCYDVCVRALPSCKK